ncbi:MATE family efflux transporter [Aerococcaceae bacterium zg-BR22]|uniref:MATE family efflux transporter n=1 Tax=Aerococcaceae bacterium zg-1292 TaxID=2774330 RepID=UPI0040649E8E|nr:MATE family efflux transporter [Aerococcaceae bacterium zg-BR22]
MLVGLRKRLSISTISFKEMVTVIIPIVVDQFFLVAFNFINTYMISDAGADAISAVNIIGTLNVFFSQIFAALSLAATVMIARSVGQQNFTSIRRIFVNVIAMAITIGFVLLVLLSLFRGNIVSIMANSAGEKVYYYAEIFFIGTILSYPFQALIDAINGSLRGIAQTKATLKISLLINAMYVIGNIIFIRILNFAVLGLCFSLVLSRIFGLIMAFFVSRKFSQFFRLSRTQFHMLSLIDWKTILLTFVPFALEGLFFNGGKIIIQLMIVGFGTQIIAANAIIGIVLQISEIIPVALSSATVPFVGRLVGQNDWYNIRKITLLFTGLCSAIILLSDLCILPFFRKIVWLFNLSESAIDNAHEIYLWAILFHCIFWGMSFIVPNALRAIGKGSFTTMISLSSMWLYRIGMGYLVGVYFGMGLKGIYLMIMSEWGVRGLIFTHKLIKITKK